MKTAVAAILLVVTLLVQFCIMLAWGDSLVIPNVTLALLVMLSFYVDVEPLMWLGLLGGLFSDLYSQTEFGVYLGMFILVILVCKLVFRLDSNNKSWWVASLVLMAASFLQAIILTVPLLNTQFGGGYGVLVEQVAWFVIGTTTVGLVIFVLLQFANQSFARYFQVGGKS